MNENGNQEDASDTKGQGLVQLTSLSTERIREVAKLAGFDENSMWHGRLAKVLRDADHVDDAMKEFEISISMDDKNWLAISGMGLAWAKRKDYSRAIEWYLKAFNVIPEDETDFRSDNWQDVAFWRREIKDTEGAIQASKEAYLAKPDDTSAMASHIDSLDAGSHSKDIIEFAEQLDKREREPGKEIFLTELFHNSFVQEEIGNAARAVGRLDFAIHAFEPAIAAAERKKDVNQTARQWFMLATFYFRQGDNEDKAVEIWENLMTDATSDGHPDEHYWLTNIYRPKASNELSQRYFAKAVAAEKEGGNSDAWISKLKNLAHQSGGK